MTDLTNLLETVAATEAASPAGPAARKIRPIDYAAVAAENRRAISALLAIMSARRPDGRSFLESKQTLFKDFDLRPLMRVAETYQARLCKVVTPDSSGTGFLVGPDVVLTNFHVVEHLADAALDSEKLRESHVVFDFAADYDERQQRPSTYSFHSTGWLLAKSPYSADEGAGRFDTEPSADQLDFALIRLAGAPGKDTVKLAAGTRGERGWFKLSDVGDAPRPGTAAFVFHHAGGGAAKFSFHEFDRPNASGTRLRYKTNSEPGSSGGLVVDQELRTVGLHHAGPLEFNQGVPLTYIRDALVREGLLKPSGELALRPTRQHCLLVRPPGGTSEKIRARVDATVATLLAPALANAGLTMDRFDANLIGLFDPAFSPLRTAECALIYLGPGTDPVTLAAVGFRAAHGRPCVVVSDGAFPTVHLAALRDQLRAKGVTWHQLDGADATAEDIKNVQNAVTTATRSGCWGAARLIPWTLLEISPTSETYLDATDEAAEVLLGKGMHARDLVGRTGREVVERLRDRMSVDQWDHFDQEQGDLYDVLLGSRGELDPGALERLRCVATPMVFHEGGHLRAHLPLLSRYAFEARNDRHLLEVAFLDVTRWINLAYDGHWQVTPTCGADSLQRLDQTEQLKEFLPIGIVRVRHDGTIQEANRAARLLLRWPDPLPRRLEGATRELHFDAPDQAPSDKWYGWDGVPNQALPPLGVHTFRSGDRVFRGCYLGVRKPSENISDGCMWVFALTTAGAQDTFTEELRASSEREWLWQSYAASYDKVLLHCDYYVKTRDLHVETLSAELEKDPSQVILDVGAGTGNVCVPLLRKFPKARAVAVDSSRSMLRVLQRKLRAGEIEQCDLHELEAEQIQNIRGADMVSVMMALFDMRDHEAALVQIDSKLRPGGRLIVTEPRHQLSVETIIRGAEEQLRRDGVLQWLEKDWRTVMEAGRRLASRIRQRQDWTGVEGVLVWLQQHGYDCEEPRDCYFDQCQTIIAKKP